MKVDPNNLLLKLWHSGLTKIDHEGVMLSVSVSERWDVDMHAAQGAKFTAIGADSVAMISPLLNRFSNAGLGMAGVKF